MTVRSIYRRAGLLMLVALVSILPVACGGDDGGNTDLSTYPGSKLRSYGNLHLLEGEHHGVRLQLQRCGNSLPVTPWGRSSES
jgi:hypothetical protein